MTAFQWFPERDENPKSFFSQNEKEMILQEIQLLEQKTSAEIRVHVERRKKEMDLMAQAREAFEQLGMTATNHRNGVLIFICSDSREFTILGDILIHKEVPDGFWEEVVKQTEGHFKGGHIAEGVVEAIRKISIELREHFQYLPDDKNELSDDISYPSE